MSSETERGVRDVVVSDTSPLIHLARLGLFSLLETFYGHLYIPPAVWDEAVEEGKGRVGEAEVRAAVERGWIEVRRPTDVSLLGLLKSELDDGEAEGIALAAEIGAELVLIDETQARRSARAVGLHPVGTLGILIRARTEGHIEALRPTLDQLRRESFWISERLYERALRGVGEIV